MYSGSKSSDTVARPSGCFVLGPEMRTPRAISSSRCGVELLKRNGSYFRTFLVSGKSNR